MLADPDIDVIYNSLPNSLHAPWTIRAAEAGKHVLCEKPLALTVEEADAVCAAAQKTGVVVSEAFMYRHHPQNLKVQELVESGAIGELRLIRGVFSYNIRSEDNVRLDQDLGGGSIWDVGCYPINFARAVARAEPVEVFGWQVSGASGVDETFAGQMRFPNGVIAQFDSSFRADLRVGMEFAGSEGTLYVPAPWKPEPRTHLLLVRGGREEKISIRGGELYIGEVEDMADAILLGKPPRVSLADSRGNAAAIVALLRSAREGRAVQIA